MSISKGSDSTTNTLCNWSCYKKNQSPTVAMAGETESLVWEAPNTDEWLYNGGPYQ
jgi:hypothetical protein